MTPAANRRAQERRDRERQRGRLGKGRFDALVKDLAAVIRLAFEAGATGSLLGLEGPLRHGIRSDLCLQGWRWRDADQMARELMDEAFRVVHAVRPTWNEGQPEWVIEAGTLIERTWCVNCHGPLPEERHKFCCRRCAVIFHQRLSYQKRLDEDRAVHLAIKHRV